LNRRSFLAAAAGLTGAACLPLSVEAARLAGVHFDDVLDTPAGRLRLVGSGLYYYKLFVKVAAAGLYLTSDGDRSRVLADVPKRLEMQYFWGVKASDLAAGAEFMLSRNVSADQYLALRDRLREFHKSYEDVAAGDRVVIEYQAGSGTTLSRNGRPLGHIEGAEFAAAYFSIWFGDRPLDEQLKKKLLGT
jgi:hypothetical protein